MLLATIVDHEGRTSVRSGSTDFCTKAKEEIQVVIYYFIMNVLANYITFYLIFAKCQK